MATKALADFINLEVGEARGQLLHAFLMALNIPRLPKPKDLCRCEVLNEEHVNKRDRIDLQVWVPMVSRNHQNQIVVIEAKFDDNLKHGQLEKYYSGCMKQWPNLINGIDAHFVVLGLAEDVMRDATAKERKDWRFVAWKDFWLRFERRRLEMSQPPYDDPALRIFLNMLWRRIGALRKA